MARGCRRCGWSAAWCHPGCSGGSRPARSVTPRACRRARITCPVGRRCATPRTARGPTCAGRGGTGATTPPPSRRAARRRARRGSGGCWCCCASWATASCPRCAAARTSTASSTPSRTPGSTCRCTCSAPASSSTGATPASRGRRAPRRPWCRSCSTAPSSTCGRCCPTGCGCGCCATPPPSPGRPTSSSTSRRSSTGSCSPSSCCCGRPATSPGWRSGEAWTRRRRTAGWRHGATRPSTAAPGRSTSSATAWSVR